MSDIMKEKEQEKKNIMDTIKHKFIKQGDRIYSFSDEDTLIRNSYYQLYIYNSNSNTTDTNYKQRNYYEIIYFVYNIIIDLIIQIIGLMYQYKHKKYYYQDDSKESQSTLNLRNLNALELIDELFTLFKTHFYLPTNNTFKHLSQEQREVILTMAKLLYSDFNKDYYKKYSYDSSSLNYIDIQKDIKKLIPKKYKNIDSKYFYSKMKKYFPNLDQSRLISEIQIINTPPSYSNSNSNSNSNSVQLPAYSRYNTSNSMRATIPRSSQYNYTIPPPNYNNTTTTTTNTNNYILEGGSVLKNKKRTLKNRTTKNKTLKKRSLNKKNSQ